MRTWPALELALGDVDVERVQTALLDYDVAAIGETATAWQVFFNSERARDQARDGLQRSFPALRLGALDVPDEDWAARSQAGLRAVRVGNIVVAPPWDVPAAADARPGDITIVIEPSMGFGTGHHATTRLCLAALQRLRLRGRTAADVGTGSGVLAIAISRLGASRVVGLDSDPDALESAAQNLRLNPAADVELRLGDLESAALVPADLVVANLTGGLLIRQADRLQRLTTPSGQLIVSGFQDAEARDVEGAFSRCALVERTGEDGWACARLTARPSA
jgi:ribosomal protein L11 methyltransferase